MRVLQEHHRQRVGEAQGLLVSVSTQPQPCPECFEPLGVEKTARRRVQTVAHGSLMARETVLVCKRGCRHEDGSCVRKRSEDLAALVPPGGSYGYDVIVHVGLERFLFHRQREEIRKELAEEHGIVASTGTISDLAKRFLTMLEALHHARAPVLAEALASDGGWPLHVDATGEDGRGTLLVIYAGWRGWVLGSFKISTERKERILPCLHEVADRFGDPRAVVRDLGRAMIPAVSTFAEERDAELTVLSCHFHFLQDVGKDLLEASYGELRKQLRSVEVRAKLGTLARDLGREIGEEIDEARSAVELWQTDTEGGHHLPEDPRAARGVVRSLAQWVLDFKAQRPSRSFPFDRPLLELYERALVLARATDALLRTPPEDARVRGKLKRLWRALDLVASHGGMKRAVATLRMRAALFDELRSVLRIRVSSATAPETPQSAEELRDIEQALGDWERDLRKGRPSRGPAEDRRKAVDLILDHLERHGDTLFGHVLSLPPEAGGGVRVVDRTNNAEESFFRRMKQGERRRSGRKVLTQDFESLPPAAALVPNLHRQDYVELLCGTLDQLPAAFAKLDAAQRQALRSGKAPIPTGVTSRPAAESAALPASDRRIIRSEAMEDRLRAAARSRAPRLSKTG